MRGKLARGGRRSRVLIAQQGGAEARLNRIHRNTACTQQRGRPYAGHDGRFHANAAGTTVDNSVDPAIQPRAHMGRCCRANPPTWVRRWRGDRPPKGRQHLRRDGVIRHAHCEALQARRHQLGHLCVRLDRQDTRQCARPKRVRQLACLWRHIDIVGNRVRSAQMHNQRVETGPPFGRINPRHGLINTRVRA